MGKGSFVDVVLVPFIDFARGSNSSRAHSLRARLGHFLLQNLPEASDFFVRPQQCLLVRFPPVVLLLDKRFQLLLLLVPSVLILPLVGLLFPVTAQFRQNLIKPIFGLPAIGVLASREVQNISTKIRVVTQPTG